MILKQDILDKLPYSAPFLFVDEIETIDEQSVTGNFTFSPKLSFYQGHFKDFPVTPGVILTETMAQIGVVCLGIFLLSKEGKLNDVELAMSSSSIKFLKPVFPGEKVTVSSNKVYFRFNKLKCEVVLKNEAGEIACKGEISGMLKLKENE